MTELVYNHEITHIQQQCNTCGGSGSDVAEGEQSTMVRTGGNWSRGVVEGTEGGKAERTGGGNMFLEESTEHSEDRVSTGRESTLINTETIT